MKKITGVLMADLSGYTALTEIHGDVAAVRVAEKYLLISRRSLVGKCIIYEITGDQLLIISNSADDLAMSAITLKRMAEKEPHFLEIHFGLNYGPVIEKNGRLFGAVVNFTSRIVESAGVNKILCSKEFIKALVYPKRFHFIPQGENSFKNISKAAELYEILLAIGKRPVKFHIDPVCHMRLSLKESKISSTNRGEEYFFCSQYCKTLFAKQETELAI
jgi:YHS domain-containing protein/class 3 adenylate cyclase